MQRVEFVWTSAAPSLLGTLPGDSHEGIVAGQGVLNARHGRIHGEVPLFFH